MVPRYLAQFHRIFVHYNFMFYVSPFGTAICLQTLFPDLGLRVREAVPQLRPVLQGPHIHGAILQLRIHSGEAGDAHVFPEPITTNFLGDALFR